VAFSDPIRGQAAFGGDGRLWNDGGEVGEVRRLNADGSSEGVLVPSLTSAQADPAGIAATPDGSTWVTAEDTDSSRDFREEIVRFKGSDTAQFPLPAQRRPDELVAASDGSLWSSSVDADHALAHVAPNGAISQFEASTGALASLSAGPAGTVLAAARQGVLDMRPDGGYRVLDVPKLESGIDGPTVVVVAAADKSGGVWFAGEHDGTESTFGHFAASGRVDAQVDSEGFGADSGVVAPDGSFYVVERKVGDGRDELVRAALRQVGTDNARCRALRRRASELARQLAAARARAARTRGSLHRSATQRVRRLVNRHRAAVIARRKACTPR
jgi:streptogramin lyase